MRLLYHGLSLSIAVLLMSGVARAESIQVTSGSLTWLLGDGSVRIAVSGDGFTFSGTGGAATGGIFQPLIECGVPECRAGTAIDLKALWSDTDLPGSATYQGETFSHVGSASSGIDTSSMTVDWTGTLTLPADFAGGTATAPLLFNGTFGYTNVARPGLPPAPLQLFGTGTAALTFTPWVDYPGAFRLQSAAYTFDAPAATPEPGSLLLMGTGILGLAMARRRRRQAPTV